MSPREPPSPRLQRGGRSGGEGDRPGLLLPEGPERRLGTPALRGRRAVEGRAARTSFSSDPSPGGAGQCGDLSARPRLA